MSLTRDEIRPLRLNTFVAAGSGGSPRLHINFGMPRNAEVYMQERFDCETGIVPRTGSDEDNADYNSVHS